MGDIPIRVPQDWESNFEPVVVSKYQRDIMRLSSYLKEILSSAREVAHLSAQKFLRNLCSEEHTAAHVVLSEQLEMEHEKL